jgi:hypothetical protein
MEKRQVTFAGKKHETQIQPTKHDAWKWKSLTWYTPKDFAVMRFENLSIQQAIKDGVDPSALCIRGLEDSLSEQNRCLKRTMRTSAKLAVFTEQDTEGYTEETIADEYLKFTRDAERNARIRALQDLEETSPSSAPTSKIKLTLAITSKKDLSFPVKACTTQEMLVAAETA